jgi:hypothetical protein
VCGQVASFVGGGAIVHGTPVCTTATLAIYISMGSEGCTTDGIAAVRDVTYSVLLVNGATGPTADQLTVHPDFGPLAMIDGATWNAAAGQSLEIDLGFTFESLVPFGEIDRVGSFIMSASGGGVFDPNVGVTVDDYYCLGALSGTVCSGQSGNLHFDDGAPIWIFVFSPIITVREKFTLSPLTGTLIADGLLAPSHDELQTPEPATLWLSGSAGSLIILIRRWKTRDSGAA